MKTLSSLSKSFFSVVLLVLASGGLAAFEFADGDTGAALWAGAVFLLGVAALLWNRQSVRSFQRVFAALNGLAGGDLNGRITGIGDGGDVREVMHAFNMAADKMEAFSREVRGTLDAAAHSRFKRTIRPEGMTGDFRGYIESINNTSRRLEEAEQGVGIMVERIDRQVTDTLEGVTHLTEDLLTSAKTMTEITGTLEADTGVAFVAAEEASSSAQAVAAAADQLHVSISEISSQVSHSKTAAQAAMTRMSEARKVVDRLGSAADEIGQVLDLIRNVAEQTNLLALNATIEAARAGEAGKGFAVVANEVKHLANQTARATEEIAQKIGTIQTVTLDTVSMIDDVSTAIHDMERVSTSISVAVEEQTAATSEIARTINVTAQQAEEVKRRMHSAKASVARADVATLAVHESSDRMDESLSGMRKLLIKAVRTSSNFANRRKSLRRATMLEGELRVDDTRAKTMIHDLSESGAMVVQSKDVTCERGDHIGLRIAGETNELSAEITACTDTFLHLNFTDATLPIEQVVALSRGSIETLLDHSKNDHLQFVKDVADAVEGRKSLLATQLSTHHTCRLGRWYDNVTDDRMQDLPSFKALVNRHRQVHSKARDVVTAVNGGRPHDAAKLLNDLKSLSKAVADNLESLKREYLALED